MGRREIVMDSTATNAPLSTESFISAASFQETTYCEREKLNSLPSVYPIT